MYKIVKPQDRSLLTKWLDDAEQRMAQLGDAGSVRHRRLLELGQPAAYWNLKQVQEYAPRLHAIAGEFVGETGWDAVVGGLDKVNSGLRGLQAMGVSTAPEDESRSDAWYAELDKVFKGAEEIHAASLASAPTYAKLQNARKVLGQIECTTTGVDDLLVLECDGQPVAMAAWHASGTEVSLDDLVTSPANLAENRSGSVSVLMEHLARKAKADNTEVSLIPLNSAVQEIYKRWGFNPDNPANQLSRMSLRQPNLDNFLETHCVLGPPPSKMSPITAEQPSPRVAAIFDEVTALLSPNHNTTTRAQPLPTQLTLQTPPQPTPLLQLGGQPH